MKRTNHEAPHVVFSCLLSSADETGGGGEAGTNYRGPAVRKGVQGPTVLHGPVYESRLAQKMFLYSKVSRPALRPTQPPIQRVSGFFPRGEVAGRDVDH
jgi:hypothetical protein